MDNANSTLITAREVVRYSPDNLHGDVAHKCTFIIQKEEKLFRKCLGWAFYQALLADKISYPQGTWSVFMENASYAVGDIVMFYDDLYIATQATTGQKPVANSAFWSEAPKFNNPLYEFLWVRYLRYLLAYSVLNTGILSSAIRSTATGLQRTADKEQSRPATLAEIDAFKHEMDGDTRDILENMDFYIKENPNQYPLYRDGDYCKAEVCVIRKKRHFGFNTSQYERY